MRSVFALLSLLALILVLPLSVYAGKTVLSKGEFIEKAGSTDKEFRAFVGSVLDKAGQHPCVIKHMEEGRLPEMHFSFSTRKEKTTLEVWSGDCE